MSAETKNRKAFELVTQSFRDLDDYKESKEWGRLRSALDKLEHALSLDPEYLLAIYYCAMVNDAFGRAKDATEQFEKLLASYSDQLPSTKAEIHYFLGIAYYHRYSRQFLEKAMAHLETAISGTANPIKLLAQTGLAITYTMRIIQWPDQIASGKLDAQEFFERAQAQKALVLSELAKPAGIDEETLNEVRWGTCETDGISRVYHSDYYGTREVKVKELQEALGMLEVARGYSPRNWANYCDLGSTHMRLGHWLKGRPESASHFDQALSFLNEVVRELRPGYGFALYEIGRAYRLRGEFGKAIEYFNSSLDVPRDYRDIRDDSVKAERHKAENEDDSYLDVMHG